MPQQRTGGDVQWNLNKGVVVCSGNENMVALVALDNMVALTYLLKIGGTQDLKLVQLAKEIWDHLLECGITLTAEYLPSILNVTADRDSRNNSNSSERKLAPQLFQRASQLRGTPEINLFDQDLLFVEARSIEPSSRCLPTKLFP